MLEAGHIPLMLCLLFSAFGGFWQIHGWNDNHSFLHSCTLCHLPAEVQGTVVIGISWKMHEKWGHLASGKRAPNDVMILAFSVLWLAVSPGAAWSGNATSTDWPTWLYLWQRDTWNTCVSAGQSWHGSSFTHSEPWTCEPACSILYASLFFFLAHQSRENFPDHRVLLFPVPWRRQRWCIDVFMWDSHKSVRPRGETSATTFGWTISWVFK